MSLSRARQSSCRRNRIQQCDHDASFSSRQSAWCGPLHQWQVDTSQRSIVLAVRHRTVYTGGWWNSHERSKPRPCTAQCEVNNASTSTAKCQSLTSSQRRPTAYCCYFILPLNPRRGNMCTRGIVYKIISRHSENSVWKNFFQEYRRYGTAGRHSSLTNSSHAQLVRAKILLTTWLCNKLNTRKV